MFWNNSSKSEIGRWKDKYKEQLSELEKKQQAWQQTETMLLLAFEHVSQLATPRGDKIDHQLARLRQQVRNRTATNQLNQEFIDLIDAIQGITGGNKIPTTNKVAQPDAEKDNMQQVLLSLIEHLDIPARFDNRLDFIKKQLLFNYEDSHAAIILKSLAELITEINSTAHKEKEELEEFLQELTGKLKEIDHLLQDTAVETMAFAKSGEELDITVTTHVEDIEKGVRDADDLNHLQSFIFDRLEKIRHHMEDFKQSETKRHVNLEAQLGNLQNQLSNMESETAHLRSNLLKKQIQATRDPLTNAYNRLAFDERLELEFERHYRYEKPLCLLIWDVDFFKNINDTFGHQAGDKVLITLTQTFLKKIRKTDFFARYGGEEFVLLMPEANLKTAYKVAEKLRQAVEELDFHYQEKLVKISISCGIAEFHVDDTPATVIKRADDALYKAKNSGRNRCELEQL